MENNNLKNALRHSVDAREFRRRTAVFGALFALDAGGVLACLLVKETGGVLIALLVLLLILSAMCLFYIIRIALIYSKADSYTVHTVVLDTPFQGGNRRFYFEVTFDENGKKVKACSRLLFSDQIFSLYTQDQCRGKTASIAYDAKSDDLVILSIEGLD